MFRKSKLLKYMPVEQNKPKISPRITSVIIKSYIYIYIYIYREREREGERPPPQEEDLKQGLFFKRNLTGLNSEFSFSYVVHHTKAKEPNLPFYLLEGE